MAILKFPKNPVNGQTYISDDKTWIYNGTRGIWESPAPTLFSNVMQNISTSIIPSEDDTYDLGSPTKKWKDLYLSGNTIYLGSLKLSDDNGSVKVVTLNGDAEVATAVSPISGGTGLTSYTTGDMIYSNSANSLAKLNIGADGTILVSDGTKPIWVDASSVLSDDSVEYAVLTNGKLNPSVLPSLAITETFVVVSEAAMLALIAERGDVAIRTDINKTFILATDNPGTLNDWKEILTPANGVNSVQVSVPTGLVVNTQPITSTGTIEIDYANGYAIPTSAKQSQWDKAYESLDTEFVSTINSLDRLLIESFSLVDLLTFSSGELESSSFNYTKLLPSPELFSTLSTDYNVNVTVSFTTTVALEVIAGTIYLINDGNIIGGIDFGFGYNQQIQIGSNTIEQSLLLVLDNNQAEFDSINIQFYYFGGVSLNPGDLIFNSIVIKKITDTPSSYKSISSDIISDKVTKPFSSVEEYNFASFANTSGTQIQDSGVNINSFGFKNNGEFTGILTVPAIIEKATVTNTAPPSTTTLNIDNSAILYYTSNTSSNFTLNITGTAGLSTINSKLDLQRSLTVAIMVTCGATPHYPNVIQIDGTPRTIRWQGGIAPTSGNANSVDIYSFTIVKTANNTFQVFGSQTRFAV
jgi:hypothetical protein